MVETRKMILQSITMAPGIHFRKLARVLGLGIGTLDHHVRVLTKQGVITSAKVGNEKCLYVDTPNHLFALMRKPSLRIIVECVSMPRTHSEIVQATRLAPATVSHHMRTLQHYGLIEKSGRVYRIIDADLVKQALKATNQSVLDKLATKHASLWE